MKAPFSWPKSSLSSRASLNAAQLTVTSVRDRRAGRQVDRPGDQLLARPPLADDQHGPRHRGHAADLVQQPLHGRRTADDLQAGLERAAEFGVVLVEGPVPVDDLEQHAELAQERGDPLAEVLAADEEIGGPGVDGPGRGVHASLLRGHDDRQMRVDLAEPSNQRRPGGWVVAGPIREDHQMLPRAVGQAGSQLLGRRDSDHFPVRARLGREVGGQLAEVAAARLVDQGGDVHGQ